MHDFSLNPLPVNIQPHLSTCTEGETVVAFVAVNDVRRNIFLKEPERLYDYKQCDV